MVGGTGHVGDLLESDLVDAAPEVAATAATAATAAATTTAAATAEPAAAGVGLAPLELGGAGRAERSAVCRAEADGVDANAAISGLLGGNERVRAGVVGAVGEKHDDVGGVVALGDGDRPRAARRGAHALGDGRVDLGDGID